MTNKQINEGLEYKDLEHLVKSEIHIDEFSSKMGDDDEIVVVSFYVRSMQVAKDLVNWFEKGYDFVLDSDHSPGEIKPNRYLVYVELKRRSNLGKKIHELLSDLETLTEHDAEDWTVVYQERKFAFDIDTLEKTVPLTPKTYREKAERDLNSIREAAGLPTVSFYSKDNAIKKLQSAAGV